MNKIKLDNKIDIWKIPHFLSDQECDQLLSDAENKGYNKSEIDSEKTPLSETRTSSTSFLTLEQTPLGKIIVDRIMPMLDKHNILEGLQVQRYYPTQKYNPHYDTFERKDGKDQRSWTFMIYLSNVDEGGGTYFPKIDLRLTPQKGMGILWNNLDKKGCRDQNTLHMGEPVKNGSKYITTIWFRKNDKSFCNKHNKFTSIELKGKGHYKESFYDNTNISNSIIGIIIVGVLGLLIYGGYTLYFNKKNKIKKKGKKK